MVHFRSRHLSDILNQITRFSPLVGILGHRQVGKTTLLEKEGREYLTFDDIDTRSSAIKDPKLFLSHYKQLKTVIDECQLVEVLFPALKERVRLDRRPGQFFLSGSVRFTSKKLISESLTGRISNVDLLPLTLSELNETELPSTLHKIIAAKSLLHLSLIKPLAAIRSKREALAIKYLDHGGLPGVCFIRNERVRKQRLQDQLETILNRDLRQIYNTTLSLNTLLKFIQALAMSDGQILNHQALYRSTRLSPATQKKLLFALESIFILRQISVEGDTNGSAIIFEDQAEARYLSQNSISIEGQWAGLIYRNLREQTYYRVGFDAQFFQFRTRAGILIPVCVRTPEGIVGIIPCETEPTRSDAAAARSFLGRYGNSKIIFAARTGVTQVLDDRQMIAPVSWLLFE
jgi:predicted AAA+ superfamily ATPase